MAKTLSWEEFAGVNHDNPSRNLVPNEESSALEALTAMVAVRELVRVGAYGIHEGRHDADFIRHTFKRAASSPNLVVAEKDGVLVGFVRGPLIYIRPAHRGYGLGPEMLAQIYCLSTPEIWTSYTATTVLTGMGLPTMRKAYNLLKERGKL